MPLARIVAVENQLAGPLSNIRRVETDGDIDVLAARDGQREGRRSESREPGACNGDGVHVKWRFSDVEDRNHLVSKVAEADVAEVRWDSVRVDAWRSRD